MAKKKGGNEWVFPNVCNSLGYWRQRSKTNVSHQELEKGRCLSQSNSMVRRTLNNWITGQFRVRETMFGQKKETVSVPFPAVGIDNNQHEPWAAEKRWQQTELKVRQTTYSASPGSLRHVCSSPQNGDGQESMLTWLLNNREDGIKYFSSPLKTFMHTTAAPVLLWACSDSLGPVSLLPYPHIMSDCTEAQSQEDTKTSG